MGLEVANDGLDFSCERFLSCPQISKPPARKMSIGSPIFCSRTEAIRSPRGLARRQQLRRDMLLSSWCGAILLCWLATIRVAALQFARLPRPLHFHRIPGSAGAGNEPIVVLHGLLGSHRNFKGWASLMHEKAKGVHDIICVDLRNHGRSSMHGSLPQCYETMSSDVMHTLSKLDIRRCHLIGHSMGGKVAAAIALSAGAQLQVQSLVMMDISPVRYQPQDFQSIISVVEELVELSASMRHSSLTRSELAEAVAERIADPAVANFILSSVVQDGDRLRWLFNIDSIANSMHDILDFSPYLDNDHASPVPTLLVKGGKSSFIKSSHLPTVASLFPRYSIATLPNASHWVHIDEPHESADLVANFLFGKRNVES